MIVVYLKSTLASAYLASPTLPINHLIIDLLR
jgi:hypothetical protein